MSPDTEFSIEIQKLVDSYCTELTEGTYTIKCEKQNIKVELVLSIMSIVKRKVIKKRVPKKNFLDAI